MRIGNRRFIRYDTGAYRRGDVVAGAVFGVVVMPNLVQVYGPATIRTDLAWTPEDRRTAREAMAARARRHRLPSWLRYDPYQDPRTYTENLTE